MNFEEIYKKVPEPHIPQKLPVELTSTLFDCEIIKLISKANNAMGAYRGFLINTINPMLLISPLVSQEAVLSSKLEGTHATIEDFVNYDAGNEVSISKDEMQEIMNYRSALFYALEEMSTISDDSEIGKHKLPLSVRLIKAMHKILLDNVRGQSKTPGEFKTEQNYIGNSHEITFTPLPAELTPEYMTNLEQYIHYDEVDILVQAAWIKYFLNGVIQQAEINTQKAMAMLNHYNTFKDICVSEMSSKYSITLLDEIFKRPMFKAKQIQNMIPGSKGTLYNMLDEFVNKGILSKDDKIRNTTYFCPAILDLL